MSYGRSLSAADKEKLQRELVDKITSHAPLDEIRLLFAEGAQASEPVIQGLRPLHYAVYSSNMECVRLLLVRGSDINAVDDVGYSAMHLCAEHGNYDLIDYLINHNATVKFDHLANGEHFPNGYRSEEPLRLAIKNGHYECAELMLQNGADPNTRYFLGTELTLIPASNIRFMRLLLMYGANPNVYDRDGLTPLMKACRHPDGMDAAKTLIEYGACVSAFALGRQDFRTPIHYAVLSGNIKLVSYLISEGACVNMPPEYNKASPLDLGVLRDNPEIVALLISHGANPKSFYTYIGTPLHLACCTELVHQYTITEQLLKAGVDPNYCPEFEDGILKSAVVEYFRANRARFDIEIVRLFLRYGATVVMQSPLKNPNGILRVLPRLSDSSEDKKIWALILEAGQGYCYSAIQRLTLPTRRRLQLLHRATQPLALVQTARHAIRSAIVPFFPEKVDGLPIPRAMMRYLLFDYDY